MEQLFDAIRSVVDAGINQDWSQLASGIAGIVENGTVSYTHLTLPTNREV